MKCLFKISNLDCANCANKIEQKLNKHKDIINAKVNFNKLTITIETNLESGVKDLVNNIVKEVEPTSFVIDINEKRKENSPLYNIIRVSLGAIIGLLGIILKNNFLIILGYILLLCKTALLAIKLFFTSLEISEKLLVTVSCIGAYLIGSVNEGLMVILLYEIGKILESYTINNSRKSITKLMDIRPEYANLVKNNELIKVSPEEVKVGDTIVVLKGEKVPLDGLILEGESKLNVQALTGESHLKNVSINDEVLSGSINIGNIITLKVTSLYENSTVSKILSLTEEATDRKAKMENFVNKVSRVYTPIVLILAIVLLLVLPSLGVSKDIAIYRTLSFLVISCPCAIVISVPLAYFSGIGAASKEGILIKGSDYLESLSKIKKIIFDKTGTLTTGEFTNFELIVADGKYSYDKIISYLVSGESLSNHPIATAIIKAFPNAKKVRVTDFKENAGKGITFYYKGEIIKIGSAKYCRARNNVENEIYISIDGDIVGVLRREEILKRNIKNTLSSIKNLGINYKVYTGDTKEAALKIARKLAITDIEYELMPQDKYKLLSKELKEKKHCVAFVGDGINDAPSLALSDIGISMGGIGSDAAIESSDIVIMNDDINKIITGYQISKKTNKIIKENLIISFGIKITILVLSSVGLTTMFWSVLADTGLTLLTILNTTRILKK